MNSKQLNEASLMNASITRDTGKNRLQTILAFGFLAAFLSGALFVAGRLIGLGTQPLESQNVEFVEAEDGTIAGTAIRLLPDKRLPANSPTVAGMLHHREDNRLFMNPFPPIGEVILDELRDGPILEVVVTNATLVYKDVTDLSTSVMGGTVQQVLVPGSVEEIDGYGSVVVWGEKKGDRIIANVLEYFPH